MLMPIFSNLVAAGGVGSDPDWASVVYLLRYNDAAGSATFTDDATLTWSIAKGTPDISAISILDGNSGIFAATAAITASGFTVPAPVSDGMGGYTEEGDYCFEGFIYPTSSGLQNVLSIRDGGALKVYAYLNASNQLTVNLGGASPALSVNTLYHYALTREGTTVRHFLDGVQFHTGSNSWSTGAGSGAIRLGEDASITGSNKGFIGHRDEERGSVGKARYTAGFTPPTGPFPGA